jgi:hypothetical protein
VKTFRAVVLVSLLALGSPVARGSIITFNLTGVAGISGYVQYDSAGFNGFSFDYVPNSYIVGMDIDVFGAHFVIGDLFNLPGFSAAFMDTASASPRILNGFGIFADNGVNRIAYWPDGSDGTPLDGDAALSFQTSCCFVPETSYAVRWVAAIPEPRTWLLVAAGLAALRGARRPASAGS